MVLTLTNEDLNQIQMMINKTPFEFAQPLFLYFRAKITEQNQAQKPDKSEEGQAVVKQLKSTKKES